VNDIDALTLAVQLDHAEDVPAAMLTDALTEHTTATFAEATHHVATLRAVADGSASLSEATHLMRQGTASGAYLTRQAIRAAGYSGTWVSIMVVVVAGDVWPTGRVRMFDDLAQPASVSILVGADWVRQTWYTRRATLKARHGARRARRKGLI
jgi:hypothetical protein